MVDCQGELEVSVSLTCLFIAKCLQIGNTHTRYSCIRFALICNLSIVAFNIMQRFFGKNLLNDKNIRDIISFFYVSVMVP